MSDVIIDPNYREAEQAVKQSAILGLAIRQKLMTLWSPKLALGIRMLSEHEDLDEEVFNKVHAAMGRVADEVQRVYVVVESMQARGLSENLVTSKCPPGGGCYACCCEQVEAVPVEAALVAWWLRTGGPQARPAMERLYDWLPRFAGLHSRIGGFAPQEYVKAKLRCPFLDPDTHLCDVYDLRPSTCRTYVSSEDPARCHELLEAERLKELALPMIPMAQAVGAVALSCEGSTYLFQGLVAWYLGAPMNPKRLLVHDLRPMLNDLDRIAVAAVQDLMKKEAK